MAVVAAYGFLLPAAWYAREIGQCLVAAFKPVNSFASEGGLYLFRGIYDPALGNFVFTGLAGDFATIVASGVREGQCSLFADERGTLFCQYVDVLEQVQQRKSEDWGETWT